MITKDIHNALEKFNAEYIQFEVFQKAFTAIEDNLSLYRQTGIAENLLVVAESGCGKTSLCHLLQERWGCKKFCVNRHFAGNCYFQKWNNHDYTKSITQRFN